MNVKPCAILQYAYTAFYTNRAELALFCAIWYAILLNL